MVKKFKLGQRVATAMLTLTANSRCVFCYHQPKQPKELKKYRKF